MKIYNFYGFYFRVYSSCNGFDVSPIYISSAFEMTDSLHKCRDTVGVECKIVVYISKGVIKGIKAFSLKWGSAFCF